MSIENLENGLYLPAKVLIDDFRNPSTEELSKLILLRKFFGGYLYTGFRTVEAGWKIIVVDPDSSTQDLKNSFGEATKIVDKPEKNSVTFFDANSADSHPLVTINPKITPYSPQVRNTPGGCFISVYNSLALHDGSTTVNEIVKTLERALGVVSDYQNYFPKNLIPKTFAGYIAVSGIGNGHIPEIVSDFSITNLKTIFPELKEDQLNLLTQALEQISSYKPKKTKKFRYRQIILPEKNRIK